MGATVSYVPWRLPRHFAGEERGSITVELAMWMPFLTIFLTATADTALMFQHQQLLFDAARDASRQVALGQRTIEAAELEMLARFGSGSGHVGTVTTNGGYATSQISVPMSSATAVLGSYFGGDLSASVTMWIEQSELET